MNSRGRRKQRRQDVQAKEAKATGTVTAESATSVAPRNPSHRSLSRRIGTMATRFSIMEWCTVGGFLVAFAGLVFQFIQLHELSKSQNSTDKQVEALRLTFEKARELEIHPRLLVEAIEERIDLDKPQHFLRQAKVRIRNIGRGPAHHVIATVHFYDLVVGKEHTKEWGNRFPPKSIISRKTIPAGESVSFDEFEFPLIDNTEPQGLFGKVGLYCLDEEARESFQTQDFLFLVHLEEGSPHVHLEFHTPKPHPEARNNQPQRNGVRTVNEIVMILDEISREDAIALQKQRLTQ